MIMLYNVKKYCKNYKEIENYKEAIESEEMWDCHHRKEVENGFVRSKKDLIATGLYYNRPAEELIFLTKTKHNTLHHKGKITSIETKKKMSEAKKGTKNYCCKGKVQCIETGKIYDCGHDAEKELSIGGIGRACKNGGKAGGFHWKYIGE